jgi:NAD+ kinase
MSDRNLIGFAYNTHLAGADELVESLVAGLNLNDRSWSSSAAKMSEVEDRLDRTSLVVVVGGDGTILRTVRVIAPFSVPVVGVNMGRVGFMTELRVDEALERLPDYLNGRSRIEERTMLEASVNPDGDGVPSIKICALNDVVVSRGGVARLLDVDAFVDGAPLTSYRADAVIVATATGSTGYALSAGGPIVYPEGRVMLLQPVAAHIGLRDGLIVPETSVIRLEPQSEYPSVLSVDGFFDQELGVGDTVTVSRSRHVARFLRSQPPSDFYGAFARRMGPVYQLRPPDQPR